MSTTITPDEAIKLLGMAVPMVAVTQQGMERFLQARKMAMDALKKQIPLKPIHVRTFGEFEFCKCPNCGFIRRKDLFPQYCEFCGQAIDRSENNETN